MEDLHPFNFFMRVCVCSVLSQAPDNHSNPHTVVKKHTLIQFFGVPSLSCVENTPIAVSVEDLHPFNFYPNPVLWGPHGPQVLFWVKRYFTLWQRASLSIQVKWRFSTGWGLRGHLGVPDTVSGPLIVPFNYNLLVFCYLDPSEPPNVTLKQCWKWTGQY